MNLDYSPRFKKSYKKLSKKIQDKFDERILIFQANEFDPILNNHKLHGIYSEYRSINIANDLRALYKRISNDNYYFYAIGSHSKLYT